MPFGLTFNSNAASPENLYKFQGQEEQKETGWVQFRWRNADPAIGRFFNVDPLAEDYVYNSPYAFAENKVISNFELEGLEAVSVHYNKNGQLTTRFTSDATSRVQVNVPMARKSSGPARPDNGTISIGRNDINHPDAFAPHERAAQLGVEIAGTVEGGLAIKAAVQNAPKLLKALKSFGDDASVPSKIARVISNDDVAKPVTLGRSGVDDVFVTDPSDISGLDAKGIADKLTIPESESGFHVIQFKTPNGIASPVNRSNPGFVGGGKTAGGAKEFVIPNSKIPDDATRELIK